MIDSYRWSQYSFRVNRRRYQEWRQDVDARQRNVVFPDTAANEARFWRNLIRNKGRLTAAQYVGLGIMGFTLAVVALLPVFWSHKVYGSWIGGVASAGINWLLGAAFLGVFLLLLTWATRRQRRG